MHSIFELDVGRSPGAHGYALRPIAETLLMATLLHALAALVLGNFRLASFFERAHSGFQIREPGFNHLIRHVAMTSLLLSVS